MHVKIAAYDDEYDNRPAMTIELHDDPQSDNPDDESAFSEVADATLKAVKDSYAIVTETTTDSEGEVTRALHFSKAWTLYEDGMHNLIVVIWKGVDPEQSQ